MDYWSPLIERCLALATRAEAAGDVPVGALIVDDDAPGPAPRIIAEAWNQREDPTRPDPTAHAEILALRQAALTCGDWHLTHHTLVVSLEPCLMCAGAILAARIPRLVFAAWDDKAGACGSLRDVVRDPRNNHAVEVIGGVESQAASSQLRAFFAAKRTSGRPLAPTKAHPLAEPACDNAE